MISHQCTVIMYQQRALHWFCESAARYHSWDETQHRLNEVKLYMMKAALVT